MSIPVMEDGKVRIIFGVGNKAEEYNEHDVIQVQLVANELYKIIRQRHAQEMLLESEERYHRVFTTAGDAMFLLAQAGGDIMASNERSRLCLVWLRS